MCYQRVAVENELRRSDVVLSGVFNLKLETSSQQLRWPAFSKPTLLQKQILVLFRHMKSLPKSLVLVREDKDPHSLWICNRKAMLARWVSQFWQARSRWTLTSASIDSIVVWYRLLHDHSVPRRVRGPISPVSASSLPYIYPTIKGKCWSPMTDSSRHTAHICTKPNHSCHRNICSFAKVASKATWRSFSRAYAFLVRVFFATWSFSSMDTYPRELADRFACLNSSQNKSEHRCLTCGVIMVTPGVLVADAGQAFEALDPSSIRKTNDVLFDLAGSRKFCSTIQVLHGPKPQCAFGGDPKFPYRDRTICLLKSLRNMVEAFLGMTQFKLGKMVLQQISGIPIGGLMSVDQFSTFRDRSRHIFSLS